MPQRPPYLSVALISGAALAYEILLMRLFSIIQWHHFSYMIIGLALLGYGFSGTVVSVFQRWLQAHFTFVYLACLLLFGLTSVTSFMLAQAIPFNAEMILWDSHQLVYLLLIFLLLSLPFFFAATAICLAFMQYRGQVSRIYAWDLAGAGMGSLAVIGLLFAVFPQYALLVIAVLGLLAFLVASMELRLKQLKVTLVVLGAASMLLALAAAIELRSAHPIAKAIVREAENQQIDLPAVSKVTSLTGSGMSAEFQDQPVWIGSTRKLNQTNIQIDPTFLAKEKSLSGQGKTTVAVSMGTNLLGLLAVSDTIRPNIKITINKLSDLGIDHTVMLTGDNQQAAAHIAQQVGVDVVRAELMPEDKVTAIQDLVEIYQETGMVGDGVNDAPALAQATVGIALGGASTDVALETADVVLMADDLSRLPFSVGLGRATRSLILQNLAISLGVITLLMIAALFGIAGLGVTVVIHEGSTLVVALNALRLLRYN